ncbi:MAG: hypothetical protein US50_C0021G0007 [Candidatus Nomurabacteria bacterium GW2011_GWB1_37_5]|uniref:SCP domain-containing protein n=1 Tax=Candidatus Nomurabacteria bacterium GW2011_GWB1_37_5 TaxID=1618742 RepID=A0A0G0GW49_9BACT|nr:MAG: hypothetical protein US50_C0021G0007 [Candidatus Nomurabacteria bacterium GW2011_GWB1_37_5]
MKKTLIFAFIISGVIVIGLKVAIDYYNYVPPEKIFILNDNNASSDKNTEIINNNILKSDNNYNNESTSSAGPVKVRPELLGKSQFLDPTKIVFELNNERRLYNLPNLTTSVLLTSSATLKIQDMIANDYFSHNSPNNLNLENIMNQIGYDFALAGENLAYGDFKDERALVTAWMESDKHRANILNDKFKDIGISTQRSKINNKETWIIVEHFGLSKNDQVVQ